MTVIQVSWLMLIASLSLAVAAPMEKTWTLFHSVNGGQDFARRASIVLSVDPETDGAVDISIINEIERGACVYNATHVNKIQSVLGVKIPRV